MNEARRRELVEALGDPEQQLVLEPLKGGFTASEKYVVRKPDDDSGALFAKIVDASNELETLVLDTEAEHYRSLATAGLTGEFFPNFQKYVRVGQTRALLIDYLPDARWGGPWNEDNIAKLLTSINAVHAVDVPDDQKLHIRQTADNLMEYLYKKSPNTLSDEESIRLFELAWGQDKTCVVNSRGQRYFDAGRGLYEAIREAATAYDRRAGESIIVRDTNFNNIAITDKKVLFVDPAYVDIGNPASDMVTLGLNVLLVTPDDEAHRRLRQIVKDKFLTDRLALAWTAQSLLAVGMLEYGDEENSWMDYHQSMAEVALRTWQELYS